ncbi:MAG TPA: hypothetical protein VNE63_00860 [Candidatus Acidoferrales bacterium]|nr:hypothetical protein [Candidatus Acidoferrales bacterium]
MHRQLPKWVIALSAVLACSYVLVLHAGTLAKKSLQEDSAATNSGWQVPKTAWGEPDFSGMWEPKMPPSAHEWAGYSIGSHKDIVPLMTPWGKKQYLATKPSWGPLAVTDSTDPVNPTDTNHIGCAPTGVPRIWVHPFPLKIVQIPHVVYFLYEFNHFTREIYTNESHEHPKYEDPWWMGHSIGWWEGNTLVIDTVHFNDKTWIDRAGLPHSDQLHVIERITRPERDKLHVAITVDDPKAYTKPWSGYRELELQPGWHITEMMCEDNYTFNDLKKEGKEQ